VAQVVERLFSKPKTLSSMPRSTKKGRKEGRREKKRKNESRLRSSGTPPDPSRLCLCLHTIFFPLCSGKISQDLAPLFSLALAWLPPASLTCPPWLSPTFLGQKPWTQPLPHPGMLRHHGGWEAEQLRTQLVPGSPAALSSSVSDEQILFRRHYLELCSYTKSSEQHSAAAGCTGALEAILSGTASSTALASDDSALPAPTPAPPPTPWQSVL
jgi:hypothetical protein